MKTFLKLICVFFIGTAMVSAEEPPPAPALSGMSIAVMPFIKGKHPENVTDSFACPYSSLCFDSDGIQAGADRKLTELLQTMLNRKFNGRVMDLSQSAAVFEALKVDHATDSPKTVLLQLGKLLEADYMMAGNVWRYRERVGTAFSAESPASVAFAVYLVDMHAQKLIWTDHYDKTQQALTENLFNVKDFFKQGAKWLTADDLARFGMDKMFADFPLTGP